MTESIGVLALIFIVLIPLWFIGLYLLCTRGNVRPVVPPPLPPLFKKDDRI